MIYAAKSYWPGISEGQLNEATANAVREAASSSRAGRPVAYLGSIVFPNDELVLCLFEGSSRAVVKQTSERAGIPCERILDSVLLLHPHPERSPQWPSAAHR